MVRAAILYSGAITLSGTYVPFGELAAGVFRMTGEIHQMKVSEADIAELQWLLQCMPPHFGVTEALIRLKEAGFRLVTLTNSPPSPGSGPLDQAGLAEHFEQMSSVDTVRRFKPASEVYRMVADALEVELADLCLVAACSGIENPLFYKENTRMFYGDAKKSLDSLLPMIE